MKAALRWRPIDSARVWWVLYRRDLQGALAGPAVYVLLAAVWLAGSFLLRGYLDSLARLQATVSQDPLRIPFSAAILLTSLYLAVASAMSISYEREHHLLEVYFYGPVTPEARVLALFARDMTLLVLTIAASLAFAVVGAAWSGLSVGTLTLRCAIAAVFLVQPTVAVSLLISTLVRRARSAVILAAAVIAVSLAVAAAAAVVAAIPAERLSLFALYVRKGFFVVSAAMQWISPVGYLARINETIAGAPAADTIAGCAAGMAYAAVALWTAVACLARGDKLA